MKKKPLLIISLIFTVLSLLYLISSHLGYIRDYDVKTKSPDHYMQSYKNLPKFSNDRTVAVYNHKKTDNIVPFLNSLLDQTVKLDEIIVVIPYAEIKEIPEDIKKYISIHGYTKTFGDEFSENPSTALIYAVLTETNNNTNIILVDVNKIYNQDFIQTVLEKSQENPDKIVKGKNSILVKPKYFNNKIRDFKGSCEDCIKKFCKNEECNVD